MERTGLLSLTLILTAVLLASQGLAGIAHASLDVEARVDVGQIAVSIVLSNLNATLYERLLASRPDFNNSTIPEAIISYLSEQGVKDIYYRRPSLTFDNQTRTIRASFTLTGKGLVKFSYNKTTMARLYEVQAGWRKADVEIKHGRTVVLRLNFSSYFGAPLQKWEVVKYKNGTREALFLNSTAEEGFDPAWYFVLPKDAKLVRASGDTFTFELPARSMDKFLASPFWPFISVVVAVLMAVFYRKAAVKFVKPRVAA